MSFIVAIDGPSGTGKGTITELIAKKFNFQYLDTGATYRCVTLKMIKENIKMDETEKIKEMLKNIKIEFEGEKVFLDGEDVSKKIREADVTSMVSQVSHLQEVRTAMVELQRRMSEGKEVILDGRDIGTNVFPSAERGRQVPGQVHDLDTLQHVLLRFHTRISSFLIFEH